MRWLRAALIGSVLLSAAPAAQAQRRHRHHAGSSGNGTSETAPGSTTSDAASAAPRSAADETAAANAGQPAAPTESATPEPPATAPVEAASAASDEPAPWWRFAIDVGGGVGMSVLSGSPEYAEYRVYPGSNTPSCGPMNADGSPTFVCQPLARPGMVYEGNIALTVRVNTLRRVGFALTMRFQPDAATVSPLASLFFGARMYISLTSNGFVKRGLAVSTFLGSGVGQMQARPSVLAGSVPSGHVMSGLNNAHIGLRLEYAFPIVHLGAELTLNAQFPNLLFVADLQAFAGLHF